METIFDPLPVMFVESASGPEGGRAAFADLESRLGSLRGRRFYATFQFPDGPYRACVAVRASDDPSALGLATWTIPGGSYARGKLPNWSEHPDRIGPSFDRLVDAYRERIDPARPSIEWYKSQRELILLLPIV